MGYSFYLVGKDRKITEDDFNTAFSCMSKFNKTGLNGTPPCDIDFANNFVRISGSFSISGHFAEGFVLNMLICLQNLGYSIKVLSRDFEYGTEEDFTWLVNYNHDQN